MSDSAPVKPTLKDLGKAYAETVARTSLRGRARSVEPLLETLAGFGMTEVTDEGRYAISASLDIGARCDWNSLHNLCRFRRPTQSMCQLDLILANCYGLVCS
jgi:hypothetical protein